MGILRSMWRFVSTLGGLVGSGIDESTERMVTTPAGIKATFRQAREEWTQQYQEVRDAVSQLIVVVEQKTAEIERLGQEQDELGMRMDGAIERFKETEDPKYRSAFAEAHARSEAIAARVEQLKGEKTEVERQVAGYTAQLKDMQQRIQELDQKESQALADIISSQQIVQLNDRLSQTSTTLQDQNLEAIDRKRAQLKAKAKLSGELSGNDQAVLNQELSQAGRTAQADSAFEAMLASSRKRDEERADSGGNAVREL
ncbi:MAG: hypothetical protein ACOCXA_07945 [Planctomycetota bacterium]